MSRTTVQKDENGGFKQATDNCWSRFVTDLMGTCACQPTFRALDGEKTIDVPATFSPRHVWTLGLKVVNLATTLYTIYLGLGKDLRAFYFAYLTHWTLVFSTIYFVMSLLNSILPISAPPPGQTIVSRRAKLTWAFFEIAANLGVVVTVSFWLLLFDGEMEVRSVLGHGVVALLVVVDGLVLNTIPIRLRHWFEIVLPVTFAYILWTVLQSGLVFDIGNPDNMDEDVETNDDLIYNVLDWEGDPGQTAVTALLIAFGLSPISHVFLWLLSGCRRRYVQDDADVDQQSFSSKYVEMGTV
jgi:hypothetical protein